jgi:predicted house-cleaning noncanonical NTP pyrophosphatase (MazG superfamily)
MQSDKLIRDRIPEIIAAGGKHAQTEVMDENEFRRALMQKLVEEATEARDATPDELTTEIADLLEVLDTVFMAFGLSEDEVRAVQAQRREERGGFEKRLRLLSVESMHAANEVET